MTYKQLLYDLAEKTSGTYQSYLTAKIAAFVEPSDSSQGKTEQHRAEYERLEKKLVALLATVKNEGTLDNEAPSGFYDDFIKE